MPQLIKMRQRIKAVTTIKKITSAMRLISRSLHGRLVRQKEALTLYRSTLCSLFQTVYSSQTTWKPAHLFPDPALPAHELVILIGSQKGMCGTFNAGILYWIEHHKERLLQPHVQVIGIGKKVVDHLQKTNIKPFATFFDVRMNTLDKVTQELSNIIFATDHPYTHVSIISNAPKTFFTHELHDSILIPFQGCAPAAEEKLPDYQWSHTPEEILDILSADYSTVTIRSALFDSLVSEQSARFIAMDNATRNAKTFLTSMNLQYNKLRQAKITKELTELAGAFESQSLV